MLKSMDWGSKRLEIIGIVLNAVQDIIGYDLLDENGSVINNVSISDMSSYTIKNARFVEGQQPHYVCDKQVQRRIIKEIPIKLYHGSNHAVESPAYRGGKDRNDYGRGFYTTTDIGKAEEWALNMSGDSICNEYLIDMKDLNVVDLDEYGALAWIAEVLKNRQAGNATNNDANRQLCEIFCNKYCVDLSNADVICEYRADDSYFSIIDSFINNIITVDDVIEYFHAGRLGKQVFIKSLNAFNNLKFIGYKKVSNTRAKYASNNDKNARNTVLRMLNERTISIATGRVKAPIKMTFFDCIQKSYKYNREGKSYYE